jgi:hypothetical protein
VLTTEYASNETEEDTISVNAASSAWWLTKRVLGRSATGTAWASTDKGTLAQTFITQANADADTHIEPQEELSGTIVNYTEGPYKTAMAMIRDLANGFDGFDWRVTPLAEGGTKIGKFEVANIIGESRPDSVFEYGCGHHNVRGLNYKRDISNLLNQDYHLTDAGAADPAGVVTAQSIQSIEEHGLYQGVIESGGLTDATLRANWAQENITVRSVPRLIASMTSDLVDESGRTPLPWTDYSPGDFVQMRAAKNGIQLFDAYARCYAIEVSVDVNGQPTYTPTLVEEEGTGGEDS